MSEVHPRLLLLGASSRRPSGCNTHQQAYWSDLKSRLLVHTVAQRAMILEVVDSDTCD